MREELQRVRRARRRLDAGEAEYRASVLAAKQAGIPQATIARYAEVTQQAIQKLRPAAGDVLTGPTQPKGTSA